MICSNCGAEIPFVGVVCPLCGADKVADKEAHAELEYLASKAKEKSLLTGAVGAWSAQ